MFGQNLVRGLDMNADVEHEHIKWLLKKQGTTLADIARALNVGPPAVTLVCKGRGRSRRIEAAIAAATGLAPAQLWPENYPTEEGDHMAA